MLAGHERGEATALDSPIHHVADIYCRIVDDFPPEASMR